MECWVSWLTITRERMKFITYNTKGSDEVSIVGILEQKRRNQIWVVVYSSSTICITSFQDRAPLPVFIAFPRALKMAWPGTSASCGCRPGRKWHTHFTCDESYAFLGRACKNSKNARKLYLRNKCRFLVYAVYFTLCYILDMQHQWPQKYNNMRILPLFTT